MSQIRINIHRYTVKRHTTPHPYPQSRNLLLNTARALHPESDPSLARERLHAQTQQRAAHPVLKSAHKKTHITAAPSQIHHNIPDPLPRTMISIASAAPRTIHRQIRRQQFLVARAAPRRIQSRMLQQPQQLRAAPVNKRRDPLLHRRYGEVVADRLR